MGTEVLPAMSFMNTEWTFFLGILIVGLFVFLRYVKIDRSRGLPPGPRFRLPLLGNMYAMTTDMRKFLRRYRQKYGDIYSFYLGNKLIIVMAGYDCLKDAFLKRGDEFCERPPGDEIIRQTTEGGLGLIYAEGELWRQQRKFCLETLRNLGMGQRVMEDRISDQVNLLLKEFKSKGDMSFDPESIIYTKISNVVNSLCFGCHLRPHDKLYFDMLRGIREVLEDESMASLTTFIPVLAHIPGDLFRHKRIKSNYQTILKFVNESVADHIRKYDENDAADLTSAFIREMKKRDTSRETTSFTVKQLAHLVKDLFFAGSETTSKALLWALVYLVNYPDLQEQIFQDITREVRIDCLPGLKDKTKIPSVDAFMYECLRHANILFVSVPHATTQDTMFHGYLIPSEATILPDLDSVLSDATIWKDPEVFRPSRFIGEEGSLLNPPEFIPFFIGKRNCIGEPLARMEMFLYLSAIIQNFKISAAPGDDLSLKNMDSFGFTHVPKPYNIIATPRGELSC